MSKKSAKSRNRKCSASLRIVTTATSSFVVAMYVQNGAGERSPVTKVTAVIGYNEDECDGGTMVLRSARQVPNLSPGTNNNAYSGSGGIVSGSNNALDGDLAVLLGGQNNVVVKKH
jgi:hypothetical protein